MVAIRATDNRCCTFEWATYILSQQLDTSQQPPLCLAAKQNRHPRVCHKNRIKSQKGSLWKSNENVERGD